MKYDNVKWKNENIISRGKKMKNIVLIGMAGCGKSTIGVLLAKSLGMPFVDTDLIIQARENKLLQDIINEGGIEKFLKIEEEAVLSLDVDNTVIATGGSVVYSKAGMAYLKQNGMVVYLKLGYPEIQKRISNITTRGIVIPKGKTLLDIYDERKRLYENYSHIHIECDGKSIEENLESIINEIKEKGKCAVEKEIRR